MRLLWILFGVFLLVACSEDKQETEDVTPPPADKQQVLSDEVASDSPRFVLELSDGGILEIEQNKHNQWNFKNMQERLKLLVFFMSSCEPCRSVIPHLVDIQENYKNHLEILGISLDHVTKNLEDFLQSYNINFKVAHSSHNQAFLEALGVEMDGVELPYMVLYDAHGEYVVHYMGAVPQEMLEFDIKRALAQSGESTDIEGQENSDGAKARSVILRN